VNTQPVILPYFHRHPFKLTFYLSPFLAGSGPFYRPRLEFHCIAVSSTVSVSLVVSPRRLPIYTNDGRSTCLRNVGKRRHIPHKCLAPRRVFQWVRLTRKIWSANSSRLHLSWTSKFVNNLHKKKPTEIRFPLPSCLIRESGLSWCMGPRRSRFLLTLQDVSLLSDLQWSFQTKQSCVILFSLKTAHFK